MRLNTWLGKCSRRPLQVALVEPTAAHALIKVHAWTPAAGPSAPTNWSMQCCCMDLDTQDGQWVMKNKKKVLDLYSH